MAFTQRLLYEPIRSIDSAAFTGNYQALGTPLANPAAILKLVNNSNRLVTISVDGINDHDIAPAASFWLYDATANLPHATAGIFISKGTQYLVKGAAGTGLVYLIVQYIVQV